MSSGIANKLENRGGFSRGYVETFLQRPERKFAFIATGYSRNLEFKTRYACNLLMIVSAFDSLEPAVPGTERSS